MVRTSDPMLDVFRQRGDAAAREAYVAAQEKEAESRRAGGRGKATFDIPAAVPGQVVSFAAFVGEDFPTSPQHLQSDPIAVP